MAERRVVCLFEGDACSGAEGQEFKDLLYCTCQIISTGKEDYLEVKKCLGPVFAQVDDLQQNGIEVDGIHYTVTWWLNN